MPRGRKKKFKLNFDANPDLLKSISALFLFLVAGLSIVSFFASGYTVTEKIKEFEMGLFGFTWFFLPIILALGATFFIDSLEFRFKNFRVLFGLIFSLLVLSSFVHLFYSSDTASDAAGEGRGGGMIGHIISNGMEGALSSVGAFFVLLIGIVVCVILVFDVTLNEILEKLSVLNPYFAEIFAKLKVNLPARNNEDSPELSFAKATSDDFVNVKTFVEYDDSVEVEEPAVSHKDAKDTVVEIIPNISEPTTKVEPLTDMASTIRPGATPDVISPIIPKLPYSDRVWENPPVDLLSDPVHTPPDVGDIQARAKKIVDTLKSFGIDVKVVDIQVGPSVTQYALDAEIGTKISKITSLQYDLALALSSPTGSVRIEAPIPGKNLIGIEVPNNSRATVHFKPLLTSDAMKASKSKLTTVLGKDVSGKSYVYDIAKMPHLLVAGATGSGKSIFIHNIVFSVLYKCSPQEVKFIMIDPKRVELVHYQDIPHLYTPVVTDMDKAPAVFKWAVVEMERRLKLFESARVRNIDGYNELSGFQALPYIVIIVDEFAEIMVQDPAGVEKSIIRLAQLARATGIHLILAMQRPSTNVLTGLIKANIPCRIAFNVTSQIDSRVIIDQPGAEKLLGKGDMLFVPPDASKPTRLQGAFISDKEISSLVSHLKGFGITPDYKEDIFTAATVGGKNNVAGGSEDGVDELFDEAVEIVRTSRRASTSYLQRRLSIGYNRAANLIEQLEEKGIISSQQGAKGREVLIDSDSEFSEEMEFEEN